jgi:hypothetical protein
MWAKKSDCGERIDTIRYLLEVSSDIDDFDTRSWRSSIRLRFSSTQMINWFWDHIMSNFSGSELLTLQIMMFRASVRALAWNVVSDTGLRNLVPRMAKSNLLLDEILMGNIDTLALPWNDFELLENESQKLGDRYIALLKSLGVDFKRSIEAELEKLPGRILQGEQEGMLDRRILFHQDDGQAWVLRWEWILNEDAPRYTLLSEFPSMTVDRRGTQHYLPWPFFLPNGIPSRDDRYQEGPKWDARRARRLAKTARKERARTGQKRPRSRMPGAWI